MRNPGNSERSLGIAAVRTHHHESRKSVLDERIAEQAGDTAVITGLNVASQCQSVDGLAVLLAERSDFHARRASGRCKCHKRERRQEFLHHWGDHTARRSCRKQLLRAFIPVFTRSVHIRERPRRSAFVRAGPKLGMCIIVQKMATMDMNVKV